LQVLGITAAEFAARFCHPVQTGWRLTCTLRRKLAAATSVAKHGYYTTAHWKSAATGRPRT
jgi:hypothetical protein